MPATEPASLSDTILDVAAHCYLRGDIEKTGVETVAHAAGVVRSTLYHYFPTRDDLLVAVILREMLSLGARMNELLVEGLVAALEEIPQQSLLLAVFVSDESKQELRTTLHAPLVPVLLP